MSKYLGVVLVLALLAGVGDAHAQNARQVRSELEASMLVTGHVDIAPDGRVLTYALKQPEKLPPYVVDLVDQSLPNWRFEPLADSSHVASRAAMSLRLVAIGADDGNMQIRIRSAHFGEDASEASTSSVRAVSMRPPHFPDHVAQMGGQGTVYLIVKVGRDGSVEDVAPEQVNLTVVGNGRQMDAIRSALARNAVAAARRWRFAPPTEGEDVERPHWVVRVPVDYAFVGDRAPGYGTWEAYHPGPRERPAWAAPTSTGFSPDAVAAGAIEPETSRFMLLTPLEG